MNIKVVREELNLMVSKVSIIIKDLESSNKFQHIDRDLQEHFFHLFVKSKRNFQAINALINSDELENGFVESTVLLRVLAESYFYFCYLLDTEKEQLLSDFEKMKNFKLKQMLNGKQYRIKVKNQREKLVINDLRKKVKSLDSQIPKHLKKIYQLADLTGNSEIYQGVYQMFNTYVHFNPTTYVSYGTESKEGMFTFDQYYPRPDLEAKLLYFAVSIIMLLLAKTYIYLNVKTIPDYIVQVFNDWETLKKEKKAFILDSTL